MSTLTIVYGARVPVDLRIAIIRSIDLSWRRVVESDDSSTVVYTLRPNWRSEHFEDAFKLIAKEHGCGVCYSDEHDRYAFSILSKPAIQDDFMALTGALHPLQIDGHGAVA